MHSCHDGLGLETDQQGNPEHIAKNLVCYLASYISVAWDN